MYYTSESGALYVRVATEDGEPLPGVMLTIKNLASQLERTTITNAEGVGPFRVIPPGGYALLARLEGFNTVNKANIEVNTGQETRIAITLVPSARGT